MYLENPKMTNRFTALFRGHVPCLVTLHALLLAFLLTSGCAGGIYGGVRSDPGLKQVKKLALIAFQIALPVEGSGGYGIARIGAMDEGGMQAHAQAIISDVAERFDNELKAALGEWGYIPLADVRNDDFYKALVKKETGTVAVARDTVDLFHYSNSPDLPAAQKIAAKLGADAFMLVHTTVRFYKHTGWFGTIEPAVVKIYSVDGKPLFEGAIRYTSERWDVDRSEELSIEQEQRLLRKPAEDLARWLIKRLQAARA